LGQTFSGSEAVGVAIDLIAVALIIGALIWAIRCVIARRQLHGRGWKLGVGTSAEPQLSGAAGVAAIVDARGRASRRSS
jgi:hypothetical protein